MADRPKLMGADAMRRRRPPRRKRVEAIKRVVELKMALRELRRRRA